MAAVRELADGIDCAKELASIEEEHVSLLMQWPQGYNWRFKISRKATIIHDFQNALSILHEMESTPGVEAAAFPPCTVISFACSFLQEKRIQDIQSLFAQVDERRQVRAVLELKQQC